MLAAGLAGVDLSAASSAWDVLWLFLVPIGGGIPSGVLLAKNEHLSWQVMAALYLLSDVMLACVFEPLLWLLLAAIRRYPAYDRIRQVLKQVVARSTAHFGTKLGPLALVMLSFGTDPMTGRAAAKAMGYGFLRGWAVAIAGDMLFFGVLAYSTLALNQVLNETWTTGIILGLMFALPPAVRVVRSRLSAGKKASHQAPDKAFGG